MLSEIIGASPLASAWPDLLVGTETADDAAVYRLNDTQALIATTDFFLPIVDDPYDFGRIAAANALSDVYAMGGKPFMALAICGMPVGKLPTAAVRRILDGGKAVCAEAGIPVAGGHSIDAPEPIYGLVALGLVHPDQVKKNSGARAGDVLILGKALGIGILGAALKKGELREKAYAQMLESAVQLNTAGTAFGALETVHAVTDVTGFGLLGHLLEMCRGARLDAELLWRDVPVLSAARHLAEAGYATGASARNWDSVRGEVVLSGGIPGWQRNLLTDPQTSGGLLVACAPEAAAQVMEIFRQAGCRHAAVIGRMAKPAGAAPCVSVA